MPLTFRDRGTSGTQLDIVSGNAVVGRVWKAVLSATTGGDVRWSWTWESGPALGSQRHGTADTLDDATATLTAQWARGLMQPGSLKNSECPICRGARWVCEVHTNRPWGIEGGCDCPGPGMPCSCNPSGGIDDPPELPPGFKITARC
jgi:hypothetical protein